MTRNVKKRHPELHLGDLELIPATLEFVAVGTGIKGIPLNLRPNSDLDFTPDGGGCFYL